MPNFVSSGDFGPQLLRYPTNLHRNFFSQLRCHCDMLQASQLHSTAVDLRCSLIMPNYRWTSVSDFEKANLYRANGPEMTVKGCKRKFPPILFLLLPIITAKVSTHKDIYP